MESYIEQVAFLAKYGVEGIELADRTGRTRLFVVPRWQGRVMTSTADGGGTGFGWLNRRLIASGVRKRQFNPVGGEERLWLGPEGGPYSLYFRPGAEQTFENWQVPAPLDTEPFRVAECSADEVSLTARMSLSNAAGTRFDIGVERRITLLSRDEAAAALQAALPEGVSVAAYRSRNRIVNRGREAWTAAGGAPSVWMLGMFPTSSSATLFLPYDPEAKGPPVNSGYFGTVPDDRLRVGGGLACLRADGLFRSKIGLPAGRDCGLCGSYDPATETLTLIRCRRSEPGARYVENRWGGQSDPFGGDAVNAYNDGPTETGETMGPFCEIETSSPAAFLGPGRSCSHTQETFHLQGREALLATVVRGLIPGGLAAVIKAFEPSNP